MDKRRKIIQAEYHKQELITWHEALRAFDNPKIQVIKDVVVKPNHTYVSALNQTTALKRYRLNKGSAHVPEGFVKID